MRVGRRPERIDSVTAPSEDEPPTAGRDYADRLDRLGTARWKRLLNVQAPYRADLRRLHLGATIDIGCGNGRNLQNLPPGSVGVDHNPFLVEACRAQGLRAVTIEEFFRDPELTRPEHYDSALMAHVVEHLTAPEARSVLGSYLPFLRPGARVVFITPQERGYASDATHVAFTDFDALAGLSEDLGLVVERKYSFPFPRGFGRSFTYNEFHLIARVPG
jgi:SAM-dependent methyltransferase